MIPFWSKLRYIFLVAVILSINRSLCYRFKVVLPQIQLIVCNLDILLIECRDTINSPITYYSVTSSHLFV